MKLINADCIAAMKDMPDNSVDSIVTDPPYELGFMGKSWDSTGIAFNVEVWQQALRVLKPGGHLIAFSGSRTYHRMAVAIEDAGFEIRDQIMWVYGSGFPKSHNISKGIDKAAGAEREKWATLPMQQKGSVGEISKNRRCAICLKALASGNPCQCDRTELSITPEAKQWEGWGTALKPAHEPIVLARKPLIDTVANNVLTHGTGGLNIDGCRVGTEDKWEASGVDGSLNVSVSTTHKLGRFPANFIHDGSDEVLALFPDTKGVIRNPTGKGILNPDTGWNQNSMIDTTVRGFADSGSAARFFYCAKTSKRDRNEGLEGFEVKEKRYMATANGTGETSKGMDRFTTQPIANHHPTVKPTDLMRYLCRLITPPNGTVLDPFMGSGSTGKAAILEGFDFIGIEQDAAYIEIARARIAYVQS